MAGTSTFEAANPTSTNRLPGYPVFRSGFLKRDGRPKDPETLISRLIDRPIRPMIKSGWGHDTQVLSWVHTDHTPAVTSLPTCIVSQWCEGR
eukprot:4516388-Pyramimonas_sp.AAC.1